MALDIVRPFAANPRSDQDETSIGPIKSSETLTLTVCTEALDYLHPEEQRRIARYIFERYGVTR